MLRQSGSGTFPWCVKKAVSFADGFVEVRFKAEKGREDQAGGIVWRWKDGDNYYVARANALENNVSLYYTANGRRNTLKYVNAPVPANVWHTLRVEFAGARIKVALDGKPEKDIARKMIQMVTSLNETLKTVGDESVAEKVSCFSCHQADTGVLSKPAAGWSRGGDFSLLPAGPTVPARRGGAPGGAPGNAPGNAPGGTP